MFDVPRGEVGSYVHEQSDEQYLFHRCRTAAPWDARTRGPEGLADRGAISDGPVALVEPTECSHEQQRETDL
eukprot:15999327-Heterocapsa_arctica.AAC.1